MANHTITKPVEDFSQALLSLDRLKVNAIFSQYIEEDSSFNWIEQLIVPSLEIIGARWEQGVVSLSQVYMSGRICEELVDASLPAHGLALSSHPRMAIAVLNDYHLLGKRIVYAMLRSSGYAVLDYGRMEADNLIKRVVADQIDILLISVLMLPSALQVKDLAGRLRQRKVEAKIVVG